MRGFFGELKRRNVFRVAVFYGAGAWLVLQVADVLLEIVDAPEGSLRMIAIVAALGFPLALIMAWAFEITPEGIRRESEVDRGAYDAGRANRRLDVATIGLLVVAMAFLAWSHFAERALRLPGLDGPRDLSIAVLPFVNMSVDPDNEYFSEGLSEELLNVLARIEDFRVAGRTSSFAFKGQNQDLRAIGERLGVANILEGSVRKQGDQIRVTAQLIDARTGYHLWSDTYDRRLDDVFAIQDEIATEVVKALRLTLLVGDRAVIQQTAKGDVEAYNHYLRGQYHVRLRTREGLERALEEFQQAILIDPDYAPPYAGMAMVYALLDSYNYRSLEETGELANRALDRALALDPQSDEAWAVRGLLIGQGGGAMQRLAEARAALERAIEINPNNAFAHMWLTSALAPDFEAMSASLQRAYEIDPLSPVIVFRRAMDAIQSGDDEMLTRFQAELEDVAPDWFMTWQAAGSIALQKGEVAEAALAFERAVALNPEWSGGLLPQAMVLEMMGYEQRAEAMLQSARYRQKDVDALVTLAALQVRRELMENRDFAAAAELYEAAVDDAAGPPGEREAELAMLEIGAGRAAAAEARMLATLSAGSVAELGPPAIDTLLPHLALAVALHTQGRLEEFARLSAGIRGLLAELEARGIHLNFLPLVAGLMDHLGGQADALEAGLSEAMRQGFRTPPGTLYWMLPLELDEARQQGLIESMAAELAEQRRRYDAAHAGG
jgi:TolB-like protein/Tfp pilus assembly protein PilF